MAININVRIGSNQQPTLVDVANPKLKLEQLILLHGVRVRVYDTVARKYIYPNEISGDMVWSNVPESDWYEKNQVELFEGGFKDGPVPNEPRQPPIERKPYEPTSAQVERLFSDMRLAQVQIEALTNALFLASERIQSLEAKAGKKKKEPVLCGEHSLPLLRGKSVCRLCGPN